MALATASSLAVCLVSCDQSTGTAVKAPSPPQSAIEQTLLPNLPKQVAAVPQQLTEIGRFQVVSVMHSAELVGASQHLIIKIDTVTGETWKFNQGVMETGLSEPPKMAIEGWEGISNINESTERAQEYIERVKAARKSGK